MSESKPTSAAEAVGYLRRELENFGHHEQYDAAIIYAMNLIEPLAAAEDKVTAMLEAGWVVKKLQLVGRSIYYEAERYKPGSAKDEREWGYFDSPTPLAALSALADMVLRRNRER